MSDVDVRSLKHILKFANDTQQAAEREDGITRYFRSAKPSEAPDPGKATLDGVAFVNAAAPAETILQEAQRLTHGDRAAYYGSPTDDYTMTAGLVSALLAPKLKQPLTAHEMALVMACVKLSREARKHKRDNLVDLAGYAWVAHSCAEAADRGPVSDDPVDAKFPESRYRK